jgi:hypothetical protein
VLTAATDEADGAADRAADGAAELADEDVEEATRHPSHLHLIDAVILYTTWDTLEAAKIAIQDFAHARGVSWYFHQLKYTKDGRYRYIAVRCGRSGQPRDRRTKNARVQRKGNTKKKKCPASFILKAVDPHKLDGLWETRPLMDKMKPQLHSHKPVQCESNLVAARLKQKTSEVVEDIISYSQAALAPRESLTLLWNKYPGFNLTRQDIYNTVQTHQLTSVGKTGKTQAALDFLLERGYWVKTLMDSDNAVQHMVWFNCTAIELFRRAPDAILFDATYKMNRYNLQLMNFVALSGNNTTIHLGCGILDGTSHVEYAWILQAMKECLAEYGLL